MTTIDKSRKLFLFSEALHPCALQLMGQLCNPAVSLPHIPWYTLHTAAIKAFLPETLLLPCCSAAKPLVAPQWAKVHQFVIFIRQFFSISMLVFYCSTVLSLNSLHLCSHGLFTCSLSEKGSPHIILYRFTKYECNPNCRTKKCSINTTFISLGLRVLR